VKCTIQHDLLFHDPGPSSVIEADECEEGKIGLDKNKEEESETDEKGWDEFFLEDEDEILAIEADIESE
jgi:hypothetical protein